MRRMYSKEQLNRLIDEVSRLIAIEELDKVVPVPTLADAGKVMIVNEAGTGYELKIAEPLLLENIEDSDGNKRFFDIDFTPASIEGLTWGYTKASLNGKELNIVMRATSTISSTFPSKLCDITIPSWLASKIYVNTDISANYVMSSFVFVDSGGNIILQDCYMEKSANTLSLFSANAFSTSGPSYINIEFHLIIE